MTRAVWATLRRFLWRQDGPTTVEYAVILMLIFLVVLTAIQMLGLGFGESMESSSNAINSVLTGS